MADTPDIRKNKEAIKWEKLTILPGFKELKRKSDGRISFDAWQNFVKEKRKDNIFIPLSIFYHQEQFLHQHVTEMVVPQTQTPASPLAEKPPQQKPTLPTQQAAASTQEPFIIPAAPLPSPEEILTVVAKRQFSLPTSQKTITSPISQQSTPLQVLLNSHFQDVASNFVVESNKAKIIERITKRLLLDPKYQFSTEYEKLRLYLSLARRKPVPPPQQTRATEVEQSAERDLHITLRTIVQRKPVSRENPIYQQMKEDAFEFGLETAIALEQKTPDEKTQFYKSLDVKSDHEITQKAEQVIVDAYIAAVPELQVFTKEDAQVQHAVSTLEKISVIQPASIIQPELREKTEPVEKIPQSIFASQSASQNIIISPALQTVAASSASLPLVVFSSSPEETKTPISILSPKTTSAQEFTQQTSAREQTSHAIRSFGHKSHSHFSHLYRTPPHRPQNIQEKMPSMPNPQRFFQFFGARVSASPFLSRTVGGGMINSLNSGIRVGANALLTPANGLNEVENVAKKAIGLVNPINKWKVIVPIIIAAFIAFLFFFLFDNGNGPGSTGTSANTPSPIPGLTTFTKTSTDPQCPAPHQDQFCVPNPNPTSPTDTASNIHYTISVVYSGTSDVTISDPIPANTIYVNADGNPTCDNGPCNSSSKTIQWNLNSATNTKYTVIVQPTAQDTLITNKAIATAPDTSSAGTDITSCQFYRGYNSSVETYKSQKLISYFDEAQQLSGVPAVLLAAIARVESDGPNFTDQSLSANSCPGGTSKEGALGLMQLQPAGTQGHFADGIRLGASFISQDYNTLTNADYCDPRKSIIMAAGFIIKKMQYTVSSFNNVPNGDGQHWNPEWLTDQNAIYKIANEYYGSPTYSGGNYGEDLWKSINSCQVSAKGNDKTHPVAPLANPDPVQLAADIQSNFGVSMRGFDEQHLTWAWQKFWDINNTNFDNILKGLNGTTIIDASTGGYSDTYDCPPNPSIHLLQSPFEAYFQLTLTHELSHVIDFCANPSISHDADQESLFQTKAEPPVSDYATNPSGCSGESDKLGIREDYADMIAYYLNPQEVQACTSNPNPYSPTDTRPMHYNLAQEIVGLY